jgi:hypothetical protein
MDGLGSTTALETEPDGHTCEQTQVQLDELLAEREKINTRIQEILDSRGNQPRDIFPNNHDLVVPAGVPGNNSFQNCSIVNSNSWRVSATFKARDSDG